MFTSIGKSLIKNTVTDLRYLKENLGADHYHYESLADKVSNQILQCGILYFNETGDALVGVTAEVVVLVRPV